MKIFYLDVIDKYEIDDELEEPKNFELIDLNIINDL